jgi:transketolase
VAQIASLRAVPNLRVMRPADGNETVAAWRLALEHRDGPTALSLTRQKLPIPRECAVRAAEGVPRGAYVLAEAPEGGEDGAPPEILLLATGSEVWVALEVHHRLAADGVASRVVSMPCWELFEEQTQAYRDRVLPPATTRRLAVEAAASLGWHRWVGDHGDVVAVDRFGASAPWKDVAEAYGFTADAVEARARALLKG